MNKHIRKVSMILALLICLNGFGAMGEEETVQETPVVTESAPETPQPTVEEMQETSTPVPSETPAETQEPSETEVSETIPAETPELTPEITPEEKANLAAVSFACSEGMTVLEGTAAHFAAAFAGDLPIINVKFYVDGVCVQDETLSEPNHSISAIYEAELSVGAYILYAVAEDELGNTCQTVDLQIEVQAMPKEDSDFVCGYVQHVHDESCYDSSGALKCILPEHKHNSECVPDSTAQDAGTENQGGDDEDLNADIILASRKSILWRGVTQTDERGMMIPILLQTDYRETVCVVNGRARSVATSGCGAASLSMVIAYLTGDTDQNPYTLFRDSVQDGRYHGSGWSHKTLSYYADQYDIKTRWISNDADAIMEALNAGRPVIAHMGPGIFTDLGHYLVLRGVTEDGKILINDPYSKDNCTKAFPIETILKQAKGQDAFMVCWTEEMEKAALWGDINESGSVDINDVQALYVSVQDGSADAGFDLNNDGIVDQQDIDCLLEAILNEGGEEA